MNLLSALLKALVGIEGFPRSRDVARPQQIRRRRAPSLWGHGTGRGVQHAQVRQVRQHVGGHILRGAFAVTRTVKYIIDM